MVAFDENAMICDFAETYHIYDYKSLPLQTAAILATGLGENSRIMKKMRGDRLPSSNLLIAMVYDLLANFIWAVYGDGAPPASIIEDLYDIETDTTKSQIKSYNSPEEYEQDRRKLIGGQ